MKGKTTRSPRGASLSELKSSLNTAGPGPLYLLYGNESMLIDRAAGMISGAAIQGTDSAMNHEVFSGEDSDARSIAAAAAAYPMLGERRLVVVRDAGKIGEAGPLLSYLDDPSPTTTLVFISQKPDFRQKLFQALKDKAFLLECKTPYDDRIGAWIASEVAETGKKISPEAAELLRLSAGRSLSEIDNELQKLYTFVGARNEVTRDDVAAVVGVSREYNIFDLQRALGESDAARALGIVYKMLDRGETMTGSIVQMTHYFGRLWLLAGAGGGNARTLPGVNPYFLREYLDAARRFPPRRLEKCFMALRDADLKLKTSSGTPRQIMTLLVLHITNTPESADGG